MSTAANSVPEHQAPPARSLLDRAKQGDVEAIGLIFRQFVNPDERILAAEYLGTRGLFGLGTHSFGCVTDRRVADIEIGLFGRLVYQDAYLEHVNSSAFFQPSLLLLYVSVFGIGAVGLLAAFGSGMGPLVAVLILALTLLSILLAARVYYHFVKSGVLFWVREGIPVYLFANRKRIAQATRVWRICAQARDQRVSGTSRSASEMPPLRDGAAGGSPVSRTGIPDVAVAAGIVGVLLVGGLVVRSSAPDDPLTVQEAYLSTQESLGATMVDTVDVPAMEETVEYSAPAEASQHNERGNQLFSEGRWAEAEAEYDAAIRLESSNATYHGNRSGALRQMGRYNDAIAAAERSVSLNPYDPYLHNSLGLAYDVADRGSESLASFERAMELAPETAVYHLNVAYQLNKLRRYSEAVPHAEEAIRLGPDNAGSYNELGVALSWLGRMGEARAALREAIRLEPGNERYRANLANIEGT